VRITPPRNSSALGAAALLGLAVAAAPGCVVGTVTQGGDDEGEARCTGQENLPPAPPAVLTPEAGRMDVVADDLVIQVGEFADPDGGDHVATQLEIWRAAGGEPVLRVWHAHVDAGTDEVRLSDGTFEVGTTLEEWADYLVQARHRDSGNCSAWSEWGPARSFRTDDGSRYWFGDWSIRDVHIDLPPSSWDAINAQAEPPGCVPYIRRYYPGTVTVDGEVYAGAGVRTKGGCGSSRTLSGKASWKVNLSWNDPNVAGCPETRRKGGLKRLTLNNSVQDRSFVHERLAYRFYQLMGVPTPRANHVRVHVNGALWGLYLHVESIDRRMLSRWFGSNQGMLYEGTYWCDLLAENIPPGEDDDTDYCISRKFSPSSCGTPDPTGDPETFEPIRQLAAALEEMPAGSFYPQIEQVFEFDTFLSMWAVEELINHWDGYVGRVMNNYRVYHDPSTGKWTIIPTGVDQTFVPPSNDFRTFTVTALLARRCLQEEACAAAYQARLAQAREVLAGADLTGMAAQLRDTISDAVNQDPRREGSHQNFVDGVNGTIDFINSKLGP
jgi:hypothetical protein